MEDKNAMMQKLMQEFLRRRQGQPQTGGQAPAPFGPGGRFGMAGAGPRPGSPFGAGGPPGAGSRPVRPPRPDQGDQGGDQGGGAGMRQGVPYTAGKNPAFDARFGAGLGPPGMQAGGNPMAQMPRPGMPPQARGMPALPPGLPSQAQAPGMPDVEGMKRRPMPPGPGGGVPPYPRRGR